MIYSISVIIIIIAGVYLILAGISSLSKLRSMSEWIEVDIDIVESTVIADRERSRYMSFVYYYPVVTYVYHVNDKIIESKSVALDKRCIWSDRKESAIQLLNKIVSDKVAFYNPRKIEESLIIMQVPSNRVSHYYSLLISGILLLLTLVIVIVYL